MLTHLRGNYDGVPLSPREAEILQLIIDGEKRTEIADRLVISKKTVDGHLWRVRAKLAARTNIHAAAIHVRRTLTPSRG